LEQFPNYEIRFRNYERVKQELCDITDLLQTGESGISPGRVVQEIVISPRGDAILEFANIDAESEPVLRFHVSSFMLAETSPIFAGMFARHSGAMEAYDDDITTQLPLPPTRYICKDGSEANLYRMPQLEHNRERSLEILLHAAHLHNDKVPREVSFEQFVAIAEVCLRYKCTSPLELYVEHRWLPAWMHKATDDMPDGLLVISYAFGLRQLFTRMSKTTILNIEDERELQEKPWAQSIKDKIWAVRCAKMAQVQACCINAVQDYLRPPSQTAVGGSEPIPTPASTMSLDLRRNTSPSSVAPSLPIPSSPVILTSSPRCPKGSHWCDATNLGWLMLVFGELQLLPTIMKPTVLSHLSYAQQPPRRSLAQVVDVLRTVASPPHPVHRGGVCDPAPAFRAAINDIYNSVSGLTLYDVSGRSHGWALSRHRAGEPQAVLLRGLRRMAASERGKISDLPESIRLRILCQVESAGDLLGAAMINSGFYDTFKKNELMLMRGIVCAGRRQTLMILTEASASRKDPDAAESKVLISPDSNETDEEEDDNEDEAEYEEDEQKEEQEQEEDEEAQEDNHLSSVTNGVVGFQGPTDLHHMESQLHVDDSQLIENKVLLSGPNHKVLSGGMI
jgi:hypothetical protein